MTDQHSEVSLGIMRRLGLDPSLLDEPVASFDLVAFRLEQAERNLSRCPARFRDAKATLPETVDWIRHYLSAPSKAASVLLSGPTGVGKTWEAWGMLRACAEGNAALGRRCYFRAISHPEFNAAMRPGGDTAPDQVLSDLLELDLLLFDDISAGYNTGWTAENLYRLVDARWANQKPTIYSTNLSPKALSEAVGDRVLSRLASAARITMTGPDRRMVAA